MSKLAHSCESTMTYIEADSRLAPGQKVCPECVGNGYVPTKTNVEDCPLCKGEGVILK
jgi:DnaJ-class molecular chaperone